MSPAAHHLRHLRHRRTIAAASLLVVSASCNGSGSSTSTGTTDQTGGAGGSTAGVGGSSSAGAGGAGQGGTAGGAGGPAAGASGGSALGGTTAAGAGGSQTGPILCDGDLQNDGTVSSVQQAISTITTNACCDVGIKLCYSWPGGPDKWGTAFWCKNGVSTDTLPTAITGKGHCDPSTQWTQSLSSWGQLYCCG